MRKPINYLVLLIFLLVSVSFFINYGISFISIDNIDFPSFYSAAKIAFDDKLSPYDYEQLNQAGVFRGPPYMYPPPSLLLFYPMTLLSYQSAKIIMLFMSHLSILLFLYIFLWKILKLRYESFLFIFSIIYMFSFYPSVHTLWLGQINFPVLVFIALTWCAFQADKPSYLIALPLSLAIILKTYPVLFLIYFLVKKRFSTVLWTFGYLAGLACLTFVLLPQKLWIDWFSRILLPGTYGVAAMRILSPASPWNQSINGFFSRLFMRTEYSNAFYHSPVLSKILTYFFSILAILFTTGLCLYSSKKLNSIRSINIEFSLFLLTIYLVSPFSWDHHLVFVLPASILIVGLLIESENKTVYLIIVGISVLLIALHIPLGHPVLTKGIFILAISIKFYAVAVLWCYLTYKIVHLLKKNSQQRMNHSSS